MIKITSFALLSGMILFPSLTMGMQKPGRANKQRVTNRVPGSQGDMLPSAAAAAAPQAGASLVLPSLHHHAQQLVTDEDVLACVDLNARELSSHEDRNANFSAEAEGSHDDFAQEKCEKIHEINTKQKELYLFTLGEIDELLKRDVNPRIFENFYKDLHSRPLAVAQQVDDMLISPYNALLVFILGEQELAHSISQLIEPEREISIRSESNIRRQTIIEKCSKFLKAPHLAKLFIECQLRNFGLVVGQKKSLDRDICTQVLALKVNEAANLIIDKAPLKNFVAQYKNYLSNIVRVHDVVQLARDIIVKDDIPQDLRLMNSILEKMALILQEESIFVSEFLVPAYSSAAESVLTVLLPDEFVFDLNFCALVFQSANDSEFITYGFSEFNEILEMIRRHASHEQWKELHTMCKIFMEPESFKSAKENFLRCYSWLNKGIKNAKPRTHKEKETMQCLKLFLANLEGVKDERLYRPARKVLRNLKTEAELTEQASSASSQVFSQKMREEAQRLDEQKQRDLRLSDSCMKVVRTLNDSLDKQTLDSNTLGQLTALLQPENAIDYKVMCKIGGLINRIKKTFSMVRGFNELERAFLGHPNKSK